MPNSPSASRRSPRLVNAGRGIWIALLAGRERRQRPGAEPHHALVRDQQMLAELDLAVARPDIGHALALQPEGGLEIEAHAGPEQDRQIAFRIARPDARPAEIADTGGMDHDAR